MNQKENDSNQNEEKFFVRLCHDVLFELLSFGNRRRLSKLERVGRRLHRMVENFFGTAPFLLASLHITVEPWQMLSVMIHIGWWKISESDLESFPPFLRFEDVHVIVGCIGKARSFQVDFESPTLSVEAKSRLQLLEQAITVPSFPSFRRFEDVHAGCVRKTPSFQTDFESPTLSVEAKFKLLEKHLQLLKQAITAGAELVFCVIIDQNDPYSINNPSQLLNYLRHQLLPVCSRFSHFTFNINLCIETSAATNLIASILKIHEVNRSLRVTIKFFQSGQGIRLPVSAISDWLNRAGSGMEIGVVGKKHPERILQIFAFEGFQNGQEMVDHLKKTFNEAVIPTKPFTFELGIKDYVIKEIAANKMTSEFLSVISLGGNTVEVKRGKGPKQLPADPIWDEVRLDEVD